MRLYECVRELMIMRNIFNCKVNGVQAKAREIVVISETYCVATTFFSFLFYSPSDAYVPCPFSLGLESCFSLSVFPPLIFVLLVLL